MKVLSDEHTLLFLFWRFCYPLMDAISKVSGRPQLGLALSTKLAWIGINRREETAALEAEINSLLTQPLVPGCLDDPELTMTDILTLMGPKASSPTEDELRGFYAEYSQLAPEEG